MSVLKKFPGKGGGGEGGHCPQVLGKCLDLKSRPSITTNNVDGSMEAPHPRN